MMMTLTSSKTAPRLIRRAPINSNRSLLVSSAAAAAAERLDARLLGITHIRSNSFSSGSATTTTTLNNNTHHDNKDNKIIHTPVVIVGGGPVGLFLSSLLSHYRIPSILLEAQSVADRFRHPAAHFLNTRTMEIFASCLPREVSASIRQAMPQVHEWQSFCWGRNLSDPHPLARVVHPVHVPLQVGTDANGVLVPEEQEDLDGKKDDDNLYRHLFSQTQPLSPCTVGHLAQHTLGKILYQHATDPSLLQHVPSTQVLYEMRVTRVRPLAQEFKLHINKNNNNSLQQQRPQNGHDEPLVEIQTADGRLIHANLCLGADGAHSLVRQSFNLDWQSTRPHNPISQELYNIHVRLTPAQVEHLQKTVPHGPSMLYTTLNPTVIAMVVRHSAQEYNIQIPTFPPFQTFGSDPQTLSPLLESIFGFPIDAETQVKTCAMWTMTSRVATKYYYHHNTKTPGHSGDRNSAMAAAAVALVGDAAHVFPPAGGFGLNTGLQDAHNLVWKLAACWHGGGGDSTSKESSSPSSSSSSIHQQEEAKNHQSALASSTPKFSGSDLQVGAALASYQSERQPIALQNAALSIRNYERLLEVTKQLYLDEGHPQLLRKTLEMSTFVPLAARQAMFDTLYQTALAPLAWLSDLQSTYRRHIQGRIRRILEQGTGLPLLFPRFEVLFDYSDDQSSRVSSSITEDSKCPTDVGLKVGRRLPYVPGEDWLIRHKHETLPTFWLLFREDRAVDANLTAWLSEQLHGIPVQGGHSAVVTDADTVVLVRPDDMVAAILPRCSQTPGFEMLLLQAALDSFQGRQ